MESTDAARDATSADSMLAALCDRVRGLVLCDIVGTSKFTWTIHRALGSILQIRDSHPDFWPTGQRRCTSYRYRLGRGHFAFEIIVSILFWV
jgi:hypothetical protein